MAMYSAASLSREGPGMARMTVKVLLVSSVVWLSGCGVVASVTDSYYRRKDERAEKMTATLPTDDKVRAVLPQEPTTQPVHDIPPLSSGVPVPPILIQ